MAVIPHGSSDGYATPEPIAVPHRGEAGRSKGRSARPRAQGLAAGLYVRWSVVATQSSSSWRLRSDMRKS